MQVANDAGPLEIKLNIILLTGADAHFPHIALSVHMGKQGLCSGFNCRLILRFLQPPMLNADRHSIRKHPCTRTFRPRIRIINQLPPHPIVGLIPQQRGHHLVIPRHNLRPQRMLGRQRTKNLRHRSRHPPVPASPEVGEFGPVVKQPVGLLKFFDVGRHLLGCTIRVYRIAGGSIGLNLKHPHHIHIVNPPAGLGGQPVFLCLFPLAVRKAQPQFQPALVAGNSINLKRHNSFHIVIDVRMARNKDAVRLKKFVIAGDNAVQQRLIAGTISKPQRPHGCACLRIVQTLAGPIERIVFPGQQIFNNTQPHFFKLACRYRLCLFGAAGT